MGVGIWGCWAGGSVRGAGAASCCAAAWASGGGAWGSAGGARAGAAGAGSRSERRAWRLPGLRGARGAGPGAGWPGAAGPRWRGLPGLRCGRGLRRAARPAPGLSRLLGLAAGWGWPGCPAGLAAPPGWPVGQARRRAARGLAGGGWPACPAGAGWPACPAAGGCAGRARARPGTPGWPGRAPPARRGQRRARQRRDACGGGRRAFGGGCGGRLRHGACAGGLAGCPRCGTIWSITRSGVTSCTRSRSVAPAGTSGGIWALTGTPAITITAWLAPRERPGPSSTHPRAAARREAGPAAARR